MVILHSESYSIQLHIVVDFSALWKNGYYHNLLHETREHPHSHTRPQTPESSLKLRKSFLHIPSIFQWHQRIQHIYKISSLESQQRELCFCFINSTTNSKIWRSTPWLPMTAHLSHSFLDASVKYVYLTTTSHWQFVTFSFIDVPYIFCALDSQGDLDLLQWSSCSGV